VKLALKNSLSLKLLRVVLLSALMVGTLLSCAQIIYDAYKVRQSLTTDAQHILAMFRDPSTQALYSLDREMGMQVVEGLFQYESVRYASIGQPGELMLGEKARERRTGPSRWLTDPILGQEKTYSIALTSREPYNEYYGDLTLTLDTATYGEDLLVNSAIIFITGMLRALALALVLYFVYYWLLTRPLATIINHLSNIDPNHPGRHQLPMLSGNEHNELGLWINTANNLLASIEHNARLRDEAEHSLQRIAQYDFLTGLPTRQLLQLQLNQILLDAKPNTGVAVLCLGLDDFKGVNEQYSYQIGDQLLLALSEHLLSYSGKLGGLARLGGDQFALIQPNLKQPYEAAELAQSVLDGLDTPFTVDGKTIPLRATIGITLFPDDGESPEKLLQKAEQTMTLAKRRSRNRYQFYVASVDIEISRRRELEKDLREALARDELFVVYQPQIDYRNHQVVGVEALLRWRHPTLGMVSPDHFIPLAEQNGSILVLGQWVLEQACSQLRELHDMGYEGLRMAVNLSAVQLHHVELPYMIEQLMQRFRLPPGSLELEVTETSLMQDVATAAEHLLSLRQCGALIAIDDFGTGYSSLSYLKSLPLDKIKIDKGFVQDIEANVDDAAIVRAIIQLAHGLGMQVIAEGVETLEQEAYIVAQGCNEGQGYLYSQPLPVRKLLEYLAHQRESVVTAPSIGD
jgi:diguanylate cyclase (GGDEF)-like protein